MSDRLPEPRYDGLPKVAEIFAIVLSVAGVWSSKRWPWKGGKNRMAGMKAFVIVSLPSILAETVTGVVSFLTGELSIPPSVGVGTVADLAILLTGIVVVIPRVLKPKTSKAEETEASGSP